MYLEVDFDDGTVGRYPCSAGATITIQEPDVFDSGGLQGIGPKFSFAMTTVAAVALKQDDLSPEPAAPPAPPAEPELPPADVPPPPDVAPPAAVVTDPTSIADAATAAGATVAATLQTAAAQTHETPEEQLAHAQAIVADVQAALEKFGADDDLAGALAAAEALVADLTPESGS